MCVSRRPEHRHRRRLWIGQSVRLPLHREVCEFVATSDLFSISCSEVGKEINEGVEESRASWALTERNKVASLKLNFWPFDLWGYQTSVFVGSGSVYSLYPGLSWLNGRTFASFPSAGQTQALPRPLASCDQHPLLPRRQIRDQHRRRRLQVTRSPINNTTMHSGEIKLIKLFLFSLTTKTRCCDGRMNLGFHTCVFIDGFGVKHLLNRFLQQLQSHLFSTCFCCEPVNVIQSAHC